MESSWTGTTPFVARCNLHRKAARKNERLRSRLWACDYFRLPLTHPAIAALTDDQIRLHYDTHAQIIRDADRAAKGLPPLDEDDDETIKDDDFDEYVQTLDSPVVAAPDPIDLSDPTKWVDA